MLLVVLILLVLLDGKIQVYTMKEVYRMEEFRTRLERSLKQLIFSQTILPSIAI